MPDGVPGSSRMIHFRAWNGKKLRAQAKRAGHFTVSIGLELKWRSSPYIKYRDGNGDFWIARIEGSEFILAPAKGELRHSRSNQTMLVGLTSRRSTGGYPNGVRSRKFLSITG